MYKTYKIRLFPTEEQEQVMWQHIGSCRYIWNYMLALQIERYKNSEKHLSHFDMCNLLKPLKNDGEHEWLYDVSNASLQVVCANLSKAYKSFFKKVAKLPCFKSRKKSKPSFPIRCDKIYFLNNVATIEKIGKVAYKTNHNIPQGKKHGLLNPQISYINNKWILTIAIECETQAPELTNKPMGIDLGISSLAVVAFGDETMEFPNINKSQRVRALEKKLKHIQRVISRKYRTNGSWDKTNAILKYEAMAKEIHYKLTNIRQNYIHQTTHELISLLPRMVTMEDLSVTDMMKDKHLACSISNQKWNEFIRQMRYKCEGSGIEFIQVSRYFPSSKTCSRCGDIKKNLKLSDRTYVCECGLELDRDVNAAINLMRYADLNTKAVA